MFDLNNFANITSEQISKMSPQDQQTVIEILKEMKKYGRSELLESIWYQDYDEIPVSISEFITNPHYLGKSTRNGESIYPYWKNKYIEIFDPSKEYEEIVLTGAIGVGKTRTAIVCLAYLLYKLMCLKNPQEYFKFNEGDKITIFFLNITMALAEGVGYTTLHDYLIKSPWFLERGQVTGRKNLRYQPPHNIDITFGSKGEHALGQQIYCISGDTKILTSSGIFPIEDLENKEFQVYSYNIQTNQLEISNPTTAINTVDTDEYYEVELENGKIIKCTANHLWLLKNGEYKRTDELTIDDELMDIEYQFV